MPDLTTYDYDIFLSHNHNDQEWTGKLAERLEKESWQGRKLKVFFSPWDIRPGQSIPKEIERGLEKSRKVGLILSPDAMESAWVELERLVTTHIAVSARDERLIPLYRRTTEIPALLRPILSIDFRNDDDFDESYQTLLSVVKDEPLPRRSRMHVSDSVSSALIPRPPIVGFVARRDSEGRNIVERLKEELAPEKNQLIVLSGPGGVGKTTLAAEATRTLKARFEQRIVWIGALGRENFSLSTLLDEIATQLGQGTLRTLAPPQKLEQVRTLIAPTEPLIVVDNFETVAASEQTSCVEFLLNQAACPVLITTRTKISSARNIAISVMSSEEASAFLQLLIDQSVDTGGFTELARERIIKASDRNPLVLQWVVAQLDLAQDADSVLEELAQGGGDAAQTVFDRSLKLLDDDGRATLLALSLFAPDASREALAQVSGFGKDVQRLNEAVKRLAGLWLVKAVPGSRLTIEGLTRELAKAHLSRVVHADEYRRRFIACFLSYAEAHAEPTSEDYDALVSDKDNVLRAVDIALALRDWGSVQVIAGVLALPVTGLLGVHGYWDQAIRLNEQAIDAALQTLSDRDLSIFKHNLAVMHSFRGELAEAERLYNESLEIKKRLGDEIGIAISLHELARLAEEHGRREEARVLYNESLEIEQRLGYQPGIAKSLHHLALLAHDDADFDEAHRLYSESLEIEETLGNQGGIASSLIQLGSLAQDQGHQAEARRLYNEGLKISRSLSNQSQIGITLYNLGRLAVLENKYSEAARLFAEALAILEKLKSPNAEVARQSLERVKGKTS